MFVEGSSFQIWVKAFLTLGIFSVLWKENPVYRFVENLFMGVSIGYLVMSDYFNFALPTVRTSIMSEGKFLYLIPVGIGLLMYTRYFKSIAWLSRYTLAFMFGIAQGYVLTRNVRPFLIDQVVATFQPLNSINNIILVLGVVCSLSYFFFTTKRSGVLGTSANVGKWVMMIAFGSAFGNTVMSRTSIFLGSAQFILRDWLKVLE